MSVLSDGSQARKTGSEKELVLVRVEKLGIPVYFVISLLEMASFRGTDAASLKLALDSVFQVENHELNCKSGNLPLDDYQTKLVSATADGANVNMGIYNGALTLMANERPWLVIIHCVNHRLELAIKDAVKAIPQFQDCDRFYNNIFYLFKNSGKLKTESKEACHVLNITYYPLPKIHGTRFVNRRRKGFTKLLHNWPALITTFTNALARRRGCHLEKLAKIAGIVKKLKSFRFLCQTAAYLDILESIGPLSLIFEKKLLMAYDVKPAVEQALSCIEELQNEDIDEAYSSFLRKFTIKDEDELVAVTSRYPKLGHERRQLRNREYIEIELDDMTSVNRQSLEQAIELRAEGVDIIVPLIKDRFSSFTDDEGVFTLMTWFDPQFWQDDRVKNGRDEIKKLIEIFKTPLEAAGFDKSKVFTEWKSLQSTVNSFYANLSVTDVWAKLFQHRQK